MLISDWSSDVCSSDLHRPARLAHGCGHVHAAADPAYRDCDALQPLRRAWPSVQVAGVVADTDKEDSMSTNIRWNAIRLSTIAVYLFLFVPIVAVILLSFNQRQFGGFPIEGFSLRWYNELFNTDTIRRARSEEHTSEL